MTKPPSKPDSSALPPIKPASAAKSTTIGWSIGHPWLKKYDGESRAASPDTLPTRELVDEPA